MRLISTCSVFSLLVLFLLVFSPSCYAAEAQKKSVPTDIQSDHMEYNAEKQTIVFTGKVYVKRPDFELWAKKLTVYFSPSTKKVEEEESGDAISTMSAGDMDKIVADGDVLMKSDGKEGRCKTATYYSKTDTFVMEGSPQLKDKKNVITGTVIKHHMATSRSEVLGRVHANFTTTDKADAAKKVPAEKGKK